MTYHENCLLGRQFSSYFRPYFLEKRKQKTTLSSAAVLFCTLRVNYSLIVQLKIYNSVKSEKVNSFRFYFNS